MFHFLQSSELRICCRGLGHESCGIHLNKKLQQMGLAWLWVCLDDWPTEAGSPSVGVMPTNKLVAWAEWKGKKKEVLLRLLPRSFCLCRCLWTSVSRLPRRLFSLPAQVLGLPNVNSCRTLQGAPGLGPVTAASVSPAHRQTLCPLPHLPLEAATEHLPRKPFTYTYIYIESVPLMKPDRRWGILCL